MRKAVPFIALVAVLLAGCAATPSLDYTPPSHPSDQSTSSPSVTPAADSGPALGGKPCALVSLAEAQSIIGPVSGLRQVPEAIQDEFYDVDHCAYTTLNPNPALPYVSLDYRIEKVPASSINGYIDYRKNYLAGKPMFDPGVGDGSIGATDADAGGQQFTTIYFTKADYEVYAQVHLSGASIPQATAFAKLLATKL